MLMKSAFDRARRRGRSGNPNRIGMLTACPQAQDAKSLGEQTAQDASRSLARFETADPLPPHAATKENTMNWDRIQGNWKQFKGNAKQQWGKLTDDQLDTVAGKRESLAGKIQEAYGLTQEETEKQLSAWESRQKDMDQPK